MKKIGIYGGTFDPVHHGHLILAREAAELLELDQVIFIPAAVSPHKHKGPAASGAERAEMLKAAITGEELFAMDECELQRLPPSYTFDTIVHLREIEKEAEFFLLLGEDHVPELFTWHRFGELSNLVTFVVLERNGMGNDHGFRFIQRQINISATDIRNRVASSRSIRYLVPESVVEIIRRQQIYQEPKTSRRKS